MQCSNTPNRATATARRNYNMIHMELEHLNHYPSQSTKYSRNAFPRGSPIPKKKVRFSELSQMVLTKPTTEADIQASWYNKHEIKKFKHNAEISAKRFAKSRASYTIKRVAYSIMSGTPQTNASIDHKELICGLEHIVSPSMMKLLMQRRKMSVSRVLEEQNIQRKSGETSISRIALASMENSSFTKEWRRRIACLHQSESDCC
eukprot:scaffold100473_cov22-Cyclotella_meneghiniana.AAC.1